MLSLDEIIALARAGYKKKDIDKMVKSSNQELEQPPAEQPPAEQPPAEQPPAEQPPAENGDDESKFTVEFIKSIMEDNEKMKLQIEEIQKDNVNRDLSGQGGITDINDINAIIDAM